jgi:hypothetical protein
MNTGHTSKIDDILTVKKSYSIAVFSKESLAIAEVVCDIDTRYELPMEDGYTGYSCDSWRSGQATNCTADSDLVVDDERGNIMTHCKQRR